MAILFWSPWANQMSYSYNLQKSWISQLYPDGWTFSIAHLVCPYQSNEYRKNCQFWSFFIFGDFLLFAMGEPNELQKMFNHLEKAEVLSLLQMVVHFSQHIWFAYGDKRILPKSPIIADFDLSSFLAIFFCLPRGNQMSYRKCSTIWRKLKLSAFSIFFNIFCSIFGSPMAMKRKSSKLPKMTNFDLPWFLAIFFWSPWANQISYRKYSSICKKLKFLAFSR